MPPQRREPQEGLSQGQQTGYMAAAVAAPPITLAPATPAAPSMQPAGTVAGGAVRVSTPQIHWHGKSPIFAIDFHPRNPRLLATAGVEPDGVGGLHMWVVRDGAGDASDGKAEQSPVTFVQALEGHEKPINCLRFSPNGEFLASAGVEGTIVIWKRTMAAPTPAAALAGAEKWDHFTNLRLHVLDVSDIAWSPSSLFLASGSTDNTCAIFNVFSTKDKVAANIREHSHFVLGVAWDPQDEYVITSSSDRSCRVHSTASGRWKGDCKTAFIASKMEFPGGVTTSAPTKKIDVKAASSSSAAAAEAEDKKTKKDSQHFKLFHDDSVAAHRRRPAWSPDGLFCVVPGGVYQHSAASAPTHVSHVLARRNPSKPLAYLPSGRQPSVAVRFCPVLFKLAGAAAAPAQGATDQQADVGDTEGRTSPVREPPAREGSAEATAGSGAEHVQLPTPSRLFEAPLRYGVRDTVLNTPYRTVFAIATQDSVLVYDSQSLARPILYLTGIHFTPLTDISWSADGRFLIATSSDGYCTIIEFQPGELGEPLDEKDIPAAARPKLTGAAQLQQAAAAMDQASAATAAAIASTAKPQPTEGSAAQGSSSTTAPTASDPNNKKRRILPHVVKSSDSFTSSTSPIKDAMPSNVDSSPAGGDSIVIEEEVQIDESAAQTSAEGSSKERVGVSEENKSDDAADAAKAKKRRIVPTVVVAETPQQ